MRKLTEMMPVNQRILSEYGYITNKEWCDLEVHRITSDRSRKACTRELDGMICIMIDGTENIQQDYSSTRLVN